MEVKKLPRQEFFITFIYRLLASAFGEGQDRRGHRSKRDDSLTRMCEGIKFVLCAIGHKCSVNVEVKRSVYCAPLS